MNADTSTSISTRTAVLIIIVAVTLVFLPMALIGIPDGYDLLQHMRFAASYEHAIRIGEIIPKWSGPDNFGFGSIGVRYYPPLAYIVIALVQILTGDWYTSFWLTSFAWILAGSLGVFLWIRECSSNGAALAAAVVYVVIPFHAFEIYQAVLYSEFAATGLLPFCFLFLTRLCRRGIWADAASLGVSTALLVLTHIPSAMIGATGMAIFALLMIERRDIRDRAVKLLAAGMFVLAATGFHLAKAIPELNWVQHNSPKFFTEGSYDYRGLLFPIYFSSPPLRYLQKLLWNLDFIVIATIVVIAIAAISLLKRRRLLSSAEKRIAVAVLVTGAFSLVMLSSASRPIWDAVTTLQKIQFPWRWLELASLMSAASIGIAAPRILVRNGKAFRPVVYVMLGLLCAICLFDISQQIIPSSPLPREQFEQRIASMNDEEACGCWWPIWARRDAFADRSASAEARSVAITGRTDEHLTISVTEGDATQLRIPVFYHPYWLARVNATPTEVLPDANGAITLALPPRASTVDLTFTEPSYLGPLRYLALLVWLAAAIFLTTQIQRRSRKTASTTGD